MDDERPGFMKVRFRLQQDQDGWPPAESEGLWAVPLGGDTYRIDNTPWFARDVAADDVFLAEPDADGRLWDRDRLPWSGNCTIRVVPVRVAPVDGSQQAALELCVRLGAAGDGFGCGLLVVEMTILPVADLAGIKRTLQQGQADGSWAYEEGCISAEWASA